MSRDGALDVMQVATSDIHGGAQLVAWNLFARYRQMGHRSHLAVARKYSCDPDVSELTYRPKGMSFGAAFAACEEALTPVVGRVRGVGRAREFCREMKRGLRTPFDDLLGREDFNFPGTHELLTTTNPPDILHCHNLHGGYFDLRILPKLSRKAPLVLTLHDAWLLSGHCAHSFDCVRWQTGCGSCPDLSIYPAIRRDSTAFNWRRKRQIFLRSRLYVATPSRWLMERVEASMLWPAIQEARVIPNGVDLSVYRPAVDRDAERRRLGIDNAARVVVLAGYRLRDNPFKDYRTVREAIAKLGVEWSGCPLVFLALGDEGATEFIGQATLEFVPFQHNAAKIAQYLAVADVYVHAARADTFPNSVIESLACGTPVVGSAVGGIPEQIDSGTTGFLVTPGNPSEMAMRIEMLLRNDELRRQMGRAAATTARQRFDLNQQANAYLSWYDSILGSWGTTK